jgi:hypothetical protein
MPPASISSRQRFARSYVRNGRARTSTHSRRAKPNAVRSCAALRAAADQRRVARNGASPDDRRVAIAVVPSESTEIVKALASDPPGAAGLRLHRPRRSGGRLAREGVTLSARSWWLHSATSSGLAAASYVAASAAIQKSGGPADRAAPRSCARKGRAVTVARAGQPHLSVHTIPPGGLAFTSSSRFWFR